MPVSAWDPTPYPDPRKNRRGAATTSDPTETPEVIAPRAFSWHFHVQTSSSGIRHAVGSRALVGPAILKSMSCQYQIASALGNPAPLLSLFWNESPYPRSSEVFFTNIIPGNPIFERDFIRDTTHSDPTNEGLVPNLAVTGNTWFTIPINRVIRPREFYLQAGIDPIGGSDQSFVGTLLIYENVDPRYLGRFMV